MTNSVSQNKKLGKTINDPLSYSSRNEYRNRRRQEMKKRLGVLHYRRERLERELEAIKAALFSLDQQMSRDAAYEQLSICD